MRYLALLLMIAACGATSPVTSEDVPEDKTVDNAQTVVEAPSEDPAPVVEPVPEVQPLAEEFDWNTPWTLVCEFTMDLGGTPLGITYSVNGTTDNYVKGTLVLRYADMAPHTSQMQWYARFVEKLGMREAFLAPDILYKHPIHVEMLMTDDFTQLRFFWTDPGDDVAYAGMSAVEDCVLQHVQP